MAKRHAELKTEQVQTLVRKRSVIRPKDLDAIGVPREYLGRLVAQGVLERPGRGLHVAADVEPTENQTLAEACARAKVDYPPMQFVRFSERTLTAGVEAHRVGGVVVLVFNPAKTIAGCFKYRNKIGIDLALEALRDCWKKRRATMDDLWKAAETCRVANVMRPYLEYLV